MRRIICPRCNEDLSVELEERSAIMEYDGKLPRKAADSLAVSSTKEAHEEICPGSPQ